MRRLAFLGAWLLAVFIVAWYPPANEVPATPAPHLSTNPPSMVQYAPADDLAHYRPGPAPQR